MNKASSISKAIKEGKWLDIRYKQDNEVTVFWAAIKDVLIREKRFAVTIFNDKKSLDVINTTISFDKIISAEVIAFSDYDVPDFLLKKLEDKIEHIEWLEYDKYNNNILNYYQECNKLDNDPFQKEHFLVPGIDLHQLRKQKFFELNDEQKRFIIDKIYRYDIKNKDNKYYDLAISVSAVYSNNKKYIICYYDVVFDPEKGWLKLKADLKFNKSFLIEGRKHSLFNYVNGC